jgi:purine-binding chemotaxis protein CheW
MAAESLEQQAALVAAVPREMLTFRVGAEEYGIDILSVQEIRSYEPPTRLANAPAFVKGVVNLRGTIVPIADLRLQFGLADSGVGPATVVIVLNVASRVVGIVVDAVSDVVALAAEQVRPAPKFDSMVDASHIIGLAALQQADNTAERLLILLDIERLITSTAMGLVASA